MIGVLIRGIIIQSEAMDMGIIKKLDVQLSNMIAAGEVVERPMGIVKELIENAIDAKATKIDVSLLQGGIESLVVRDNGHGMDAADAVAAFERHATSKIAKTSDLWSINTLGFRGEALPSIASVSQVQLETNNGQESTKVSIHYGEMVEVKPTPTNQGTRIEVKGLFHRTPARLKHLKTVPYENAKVVEVLQKFALSHPEIAFSLTSDKKELFKTSGSNDLLEVVYQIYGKEIAKQAIVIDERDADYHLSGLCIHPQFNRANRNAMTIFLNGRMVKPYRIQKAIEEAYRDYIPQGRYPIVVLNIQMDTQLVDVNVHPSKWEVRLSKEQQLEHFIKEALPEALRQSLQAPQVHLERVVKNKVEQPTFFEEREIPQRIIQEEPVAYKPQALPQRPQRQEPIVEEIQETIQPLPKKAFPQLRVIGQMHGKYILCEGDEGLYIVDQHAAQERVNYERFQLALEEKQDIMEECLIPLMINAPKDLVQRVEELNQQVQSMGIVFEGFGKENLIVRQTPLWMKKIEVESFLQDLVDWFHEEKEIEKKVIHKDKIATMACHHSIRFNRILTPEEMAEAILQLSSCTQPYHCPHGRPTFIALDAKQLEREFLR